MPAMPGFGMPNIFSGQGPEVNQEPDGGGLSLMAELLGIQMPQMPSRDPYGRYGITEDQQRDAGNRGLSTALMGASQAFLGGGAAPALQGGMQAGNVRRAALDNYSNRNAMDYEAQVKNAVAKLEMMSKKSNVELQMMQTSKAKMDLESAKRQQEIASIAVRELAPVADETIAEVSQISESYGKEMRLKFLAIQQKMEAGKLEEADDMLDAIHNELLAIDPTGERAKKLKVKTESAIMLGLAKHKVDAAVINEVKKIPGMEGYSYEMGPNGQLSVVSPFIAAQREAQLRLLQSQAAENEAQAARSRHLASLTASITPAGAAKIVADASVAAQRLKLKAPMLTKDRAKWEEQRAKDVAALMQVGIDPSNEEQINQWLARPTLQRIKDVQTGAAAQLQGATGAATQTETAPTNPAHIAGMLRTAMSSPIDESDAERVLADLAKADEPKIRQLLQAVTGATAMEKLQKIYHAYPGAKPQ